MFKDILFLFTAYNCIEYMFVMRLNTFYISNYTVYLYNFTVNHFLVKVKANFL